MAACAFSPAATRSDPLFYESDPLQDAPFLELPDFQYGSLLCTPRRNNYTLLEPTRPFLWENFAPYMFVMPSSATILAQTPAGLLPFAQVEDRIQIPGKSWLLGISGFSAHAAGFRFSIYDEGAMSYALSDKWINGSDFSVDPAALGTTPQILPDPYLVVDPGKLQIKIVNLANANNDCQVILHFAIPKTAAPARTS